MADTYTDELRIRLQEDGANSTTWGSLTNTNLQLIEDAVSGMVEIATTGGTTTLTTVSGGTDQARMAILKVTGVLVSNATIEVPAKSKKYLVWNATSGAYTVTIKVSGSTGVVVTQSQSQEVFCDGAEVYPAGISTPLTSATTGTGAVVRATSPTLVTPILGVATATSINGNTWTAGTGVLTIAAGKTLTASNTITFTATDGSTLAIGTGGTLGTAAYTASTAYQPADADLTTWAAITPGANVGTALAIAVGTNGAFVTRGGDAGTPSALVGTNISGTAASLTAGAASAVAVGGVTGLGTGVGTALAVALGSAGAMASLATAQTFTAPQRGTQTTDNDGSFDLNATNNFKCTPTGAVAITFTNIASATGQSGNILLVNGSNHAITAAATTKAASGSLTTLSATGTYLIGYYCDGSNVYVGSTAALA